MKELSNNYQDKKGLWRKATAILGGVALLTACDQKPQIIEGDVYQKEHVKSDLAFFGRNTWGDLVAIDREVISMPPTHEERSYFSKELISLHRIRTDESWKVYIAQCPTAELPPAEKIKKECKTESFDVPQEVYPTLKIGQRLDFKKSK
jgi:hypothetical protein